jgi:translation elongation factor EF-1beta
MKCDSVIHELALNVYVQTLPTAVTLPIVRTGKAIDVTIPTAEILAHIAAETWYAPNAEVAWYIMDNSDWAALTDEPVAAGITEVILKYAVDTDCGNTESDKMVIAVGATDVENTQSQSTTSNCRKVLYEDHIYILREDKIYNAMGQEL